MIIRKASQHKDNLLGVLVAQQNQGPSIQVAVNGIVHNLLRRRCFVRGTHGLVLQNADGINVFDHADGGFPKEQAREQQGPCCPAAARARGADGCSREVPIGFWLQAILKRSFFQSRFTFAYDSRGEMA